MEDDDVGAVDGVRAFLNAAQTIPKDESQGSESCNRKNQETKQEPAIEPEFHSSASRGREAEFGVVSGHRDSRRN